MAIVGITCEKDGTLIQRLPVNTKVAIGLGPSGQKNHPEKLDAFVFLRRGAGESDWVQDEKLMAHYSPKCKHPFGETCPDCCRMVNVLFLDDDIDHILKTEYAWWTQTNKKCWGDGLTATRRTEEFPNGAKWTPCGDECPDLKREAKRCKPSGDLYFLFQDFPSLGSVCRLHTSSVKSIKNLYGGLSQISAVMDGKLAGVPVPLQVSWEKTSYKDKDGKERPTEVPILGFKTDLLELTENIEKMANLFSVARKALGASRAVVVEDETAKAAEISAEFNQKALPEAPESAKATEPPPPAEKAAPAAATPPPQASQPASEKPKSEKPKVEKLAVKFHGMPKAMTENAIASGPNKGKPFWKLKLEAAGGDVTLLVFSRTVREKIDGAIKRSQEVELDCESQVRAENSFTKVNDVAFLTKTPEPEPAGEEPPADWMLD